jgi:hypothetical protein
VWCGGREVASKQAQCEERWGTRWWNTLFTPSTCPAGIKPTLSRQTVLQEGMGVYIHTPFFLRETSDFSPRFNLHRLVSPFRLLILGRTYGTYLHYERSYSMNVFLLLAGREQRPLV